MSREEELRVHIRGMLRLLARYRSDLRCSAHPMTIPANENPPQLALGG
jgi:hypothetical protein